MKSLNISVFIMLILTNCYDKNSTLSMIDKISFIDSISFEVLKGYTLIYGYSHWDVCGSPCGERGTGTFSCKDFKINN